MPGKIEIQVITPNPTGQEKHKFHGQSDMIILCCETGDMGILPGRVACSAILGDGALRVIDEEETRKIAVFGGVFHFENDVLTVLTQKAFFPSEIDITTTQALIQEHETSLTHEMNPTNKDIIRKELRRKRVLLDVASS